MHAHGSCPESEWFELSVHVQDVDLETSCQIYTLYGLQGGCQSIQLGVMDVFCRPKLDVP